MLFRAGPRYSDFCTGYFAATFAVSLHLPVHFRRGLLVFSLRSIGHGFHSDIHYHMELTDLAVAGGVTTFLTPLCVPFLDVDSRAGEGIFHPAADMETALIGVFTSLDLFSLFLLEATLKPMALLIGILATSAKFARD